MKFGDVVQVRQMFQGAPHWIYARVQNVDADGGAVVVISHPQNPDDGKTLMFSAAEIRTKAQLQEEHDAIDELVSKKKLKPQEAMEQRRALQSQINSLS